MQSDHLLSGNKLIDTIYFIYVETCVQIDIMFLSEFLEFRHFVCIDKNNFPNTIHISRQVRAYYTHVSIHTMFVDRIVKSRILSRLFFDLF